MRIEEIHKRLKHLKGILECIKTTDHIDRILIEIEHYERMRDKALREMNPSSCGTEPGV